MSKMQKYIRTDEGEIAFLRIAHYLLLYQILKGIKVMQ